MPPDKIAKRKNFVNKKGHFQEVSVYQGPIPAPENLDKYDKMIPNGAERFMVMSEKEQEHRHRFLDKQLENEKYLLKSNKRYNNKSLFICFLVILFVLSLCAFGFYKGYPTQSTTVFGVLSALVAYLTRQTNQNK